MKIVLFEIGLAPTKWAKCKYVTGVLELTDMKVLRDCINEMISNREGMMPKGKRNEL